VTGAWPAAWGHRDPFDRMVAAQAILEGAVSVSADRVFDTAPGVRRLW
jgi:PIN domain nuclease of toxin-antitoxin system